MKQHEISEKQWNRIKDLFPPEKKPQGGRPGKSNREIVAVARSQLGNVGGQRFSGSASHSPVESWVNSLNLRQFQAAW